MKSMPNRTMIEAEATRHLQAGGVRQLEDSRPTARHTSLYTKYRYLREAKDIVFVTCRMHRLPLSQWAQWRIALGSVRHSREAGEMIGYIKRKLQQAQGLLL